MEKRKVGIRSKILFDEIDLRIIQLLNNPKNNDGLGVLEIAKWFGVMHNNLKPHLDKLLSLGLILFSPNKEGKSVLFSRKGKEQEIFLKYLANANMYLFNKEMNKAHGIDLRTKEAKKFIKPMDCNPFKDN